MNLDAISKMTDAEFETHIQNILNTGKKNTKASLPSFEYIPTPPKTPISLPKEAAKSVGRAALNVGKLAARTAQGGALDVGALLGYSPEENKVAQAAQQGAKFLESYSEPEGSLARNPEFEKEHPWLSTGMDVAEGAAPWLAAGVATEATGGALGPLILPVAAGLSHQGESVERQMKRGVSGNEALLRSVPGAATNAAMFALMPKAMNKLKGKVNPITGEVTNGILGAPTRGITKGALQGLAADTPYLLAQGEIGQGVDVASGAMTGEEWKQGHTVEAIKKNLLQTAITGAGFGAIHGATTPKIKEPIIDDKTPVDVTKIAEPIVETSPELKKQGVLDLGIKSLGREPEYERDFLSILPQGEGVFAPKMAELKIKQLKKAGIEPLVKEEMDVLGNKKIRISLNKEEDIINNAEQQLAFDFNNELDLTGTATPKLETKPIPMQPDMQLFEPAQLTPELPIEASTQPVVDKAIKQPNLTEKASKIKRGSEAKVQENKSIVEVNPVEPISIETKVRRKVKENQPVEFDIKSAIQDFMTNPESKFKAEQFTELGKTVEELNAARANNIKEFKVEPKSVARVVESKVVEPKIVKPKKEVIKPQKEVINKTEGIVETPSGAEYKDTEVRKAMKQYAKGSAGYEDTLFARDLHRELNRTGKLSHKDIIKIWDANKDVYEVEDAHKIGTGKDKARDQKAYQDRSIETLFKALQEGKIDAIPSKVLGDHFVTKSGATKESHQTWYEKTIAGQKRNKSQGLTSPYETLDRGVVEEKEAPKSAADIRRIERAERLRGLLSKRANRPHTIIREKLTRFNREVIRLEGAIATLSKGKERTELTKELKHTKENLTKLRTQDDYSRFKEEYDKANKELKGKKLEARLKELKEEASKTGTLDIEKKLAELHDKLGVKDRTKDTSEYDAITKGEEAKAKYDRDSRFLDEITSADKSDPLDVLDAKDEIFALRDSYEKEATYKKLTTDKERVSFLRQVAKEAYSRLAGGPQKRGLLSSERPVIQEYAGGNLSIPNRELDLARDLGKDYSESSADVVFSHTIDSIKAELGKDAKRVDIIQSQEDLPPLVKAQMKSEGVDSIEGYYDRNTGKIVLIADNIENTVGVVQRIFAHEITHHGIQSLGKRGEQLLNQIYVAHKAEIDAMMSSKTDRLDRTNEFVARFGETGLKQSLWQKVQNFLKDTWAKITGKEVTDKDLRDIMSEVRKALKNDNNIGDTGIDYSESKFKPYEQHIERVKEIFDPSNNESIAKNITKYFSDYFSESGLVKTAIKGLLRPAYWNQDLREASVNMNKSIEVKSMLQHLFRGDSNKGLGDIKALSLKDISVEYNAMPLEAKRNFHKLVVLGDQQEKVWNSLAEARKDAPNITDAEFKMYQKYISFGRQVRNKMIAEFANTAAHTMTDIPEMVIPIKEAIQSKQLKTDTDFINFFENHRNIKRVGLDTVVSKLELKAILTQLKDPEGVKAKYAEVSGNYGERKMDWYMPRERLEGGEYIVELNKVDTNGVETKIFNQAFYNLMEAERVARDLKINPTKYVPANFKGLQSGESLKLDGIKVRRITTKERFGYKDDQAIVDMVDKVLKRSDVSEAEIKDITQAVRQEIMNKLLEQHGQRNIIKRKETLIEGYNEDSPFDAIETMLNRTANSYSKMRYVSDQMKLLETISADKKPEFKEYVRQTLMPTQFGGKQAQYLKNATAVYFMGFRPLTAIMQLTQLHTVGAAELGAHLEQAGIRTPAQILLAKAGKDVMFKNLTKAEQDVMRIAEDVGATFENSSQTSLFAGVEDQAVRTRFGKRLAKASDWSMKMFKMAEAYNRKAAILASYRVFAKGKTEFDRAAYNKAIEFNNNTNFMLNKGNIPYMFMHNPLGMSAYSLMSYTLNMSNWMFNRFHGSISDTGLTKGQQRRAFMKFLGYTAVLAGASGLPFADDLNKGIRKLFGRDLKRETETFLKRNAGKDITTLLTNGIFAPAGVNITSNMSLRLPFVSGLLDDKSLAESAFGATGALLGKGVRAYSAAVSGEGRKFAEAVLPEFASGALRAERMYRQGQRDASGKPILYQGKPFKLSGSEALAQGVLGLKSQRRAEMMETVDSEIKLKKYWEGEKKLAMKKFAEGDKTALQKFNRELIKNKDARLVVKPPTSEALKPKREKAGKVAFELG